MAGNLKESISTTANVGVVSVDNTEGINELIEQQVLQACAALKARGVTSAKLKLTFKANIES